MRKWWKEIVILVAGVFSLVLSMIAGAGSVWNEPQASASEPEAEPVVKTAAGPMLNMRLPFDRTKDEAALMQAATDGVCVQLCIAVGGKLKRCAAAELDGKSTCPEKLKAEEKK